MERMGPQSATAGVDAALAQLARRPHGVFTADQAMRTGISKRMLSKLAARGRIYRLFRGVYSVIPPRHLAQESWWLAAVLACGEGAALSHLAAAALWDLRPQPTLIDVTVPGDGGRCKRSGLRIHRSQTLSRDVVTSRRSVPITTPERTLLDLRRLLPSSEWRQ